MSDLKSGVTGCISPIQCQQPGLVHGIPVGYGSDDSWYTTLTAAFQLEDNNIVLVTYRYHSGNNTRYPCRMPRGIPGHV